MSYKQKEITISDTLRNKLELNAEFLQFYRDNPCIACEHLLGIKLIDAQKIMLQGSWNTTFSLWVCSRDLGKSLMGVILILLLCLLYPNQKAYIISSKGGQAKETFAKLEELVLNHGNTAQSFKDLKQIALNEVSKNGNSKTGFVHDPASYHVKFYNGSEIYTLNSKPANVRGKRATIVFFDEAAFCDDELISACVPFTAKDSNFSTSVNNNHNEACDKRQCPNRTVFASSQYDMTTDFYKRYKKYTKRMLAGDRDYFVCDFICDVAKSVYMDGKLSSKSLLTQSKIDNEMAVDREKAMREYFNVPIQDGGDNQIVKHGMIARNEGFSIPEMARKGKSHYVLAYDPARTNDNSILTVMKLCYSDDIGWYGKIVNCINMVDYASKHHYKLDSNRQVAAIRNTLLNYNLKSPDYEFIDALLIDQGSGGGGLPAYADVLLQEWTDNSGRKHKGLIDSNNPVYEGYDSLYPDNVNIVQLLSPTKYRTTMVEEMIDIVKLDLIKFPYSYNNSGVVKIYTTQNISHKEEEQSVNEQIENTKDYILSWEEESALINIDLLKQEVTSIHRFKNSNNTTVDYKLPPDKQNKMHDDRFYTFIMLSHYLHQLRVNENINDRSYNKDYAFVPLCD